MLKLQKMGELFTNCVGSFKVVATFHSTLEYNRLTQYVDNNE